MTTWPHIFANLSGSVPASYLDDNFNAAAQQADLVALQTSVGTILSGGNLVTPGQFLLPTVASATGVVGTLNDYSPTGLSVASVLRLTTAGATILTGLSGGVEGRKLTIENIGNSPIVFVGNNSLGLSAGSTAANRIITPNWSWSLWPNGTVDLIYDGSVSRWRLQCPSGRDTLDASRTYFVSTTGNDNSDGLTSGSALLTVQGAIDRTYTLDLNGQNVTIQVAAGTYGGTVVAQGVCPGGKVVGNITILGDTTTPSNVVFNNASGPLVYALQNARVAVRGIRFTGANAEHLRAEQHAQITFDSCEFAATTLYHTAAYSLGLVRATGNYTITGGAQSHWRSTFGGNINVNSVTVTLTGTPAFTVGFSDAELNSTQQLNGITFSGSATGPRYSATANSVIYTNGAGATYLPGNSAGSTATGGQYV